MVILIALLDLDKSRTNSARGSQAVKYESARNEITKQYVLREESLNSEQPYNWHRHFYFVIKDEQIWIERNLRTKKLEVCIAGYKRANEKSHNGHITTQKWIVDTFTIGEYRKAVETFIQLITEKLLESDLLKNYSYGFSSKLYEEEE